MLRTYRSFWSCFSCSFFCWECLLTVIWWYYTQCCTHSLCLLVGFAWCLMICINLKGYTGCLEKRLTPRIFDILASSIPGQKVLYRSLSVTIWGGMYCRRLALNILTNTRPACRLVVNGQLHYELNSNEMSCPNWKRYLCVRRLFGRLLCIVTLAFNSAMIII